ncbi:MAG: alpha-amylase [Bacteroidia bacterium]|nr:alpha-amylase [Bacteroidia bacterium]NNF31254.1 alpha-amylase [Flavobacteriaceae bacterium]MBT8275880.1 alpha-amylase [Bacteroidia bacterium]NNJ82939.1 alpha-amylase [Flavobacteriaceae bacterium]NNK54551.1 alpha-amylase [Flavobacteriaceae bacterium]
MRKVRITGIFICLFIALFSCADNKKELTAANTEVEIATTKPFSWKAANIYFLLTDRFNNGDPSNDVNFDRTRETAVLRGFKGGDLKGITQKIEEGYFTDLGINAIWMTPVVEQIHDGTDEGTGYTYGYHGYWTKDWTALDPNFGAREDLAELVETAHDNGIRILLDAVINHTGPVTDGDTVWPEEWVRTSPKCEFKDYESTVSCTLVENLPDIRTESDEVVDLPPQLVEKWKVEGRYDEEMAELDNFFEKTGHPRAPRFYIMKWLSDYIHDFGIDGYRVDTVKHTEEYVWEEFEDVCEDAFNSWKAANPDKVLDDAPFYMVGEIYFYNVNTGRTYDFGDRKVDYFNDSFDALINFDLRSSADRSYEEVFSSYNQVLQGDLKGYSTLSYMSSHDDSSPFDKDRSKPYETAIRLLLAPGAAQVYYGDELARTLIVEGTNGDATLRSFMNWEDIDSNPETAKILVHWQKLGQFRNDHISVGAGVHYMISESPYVFKRSFAEGDISDEVIVGLDLPVGMKSMSVADVFENGIKVRDAYSGETAEVVDGKVSVTTDYNLVLLEEINE